MKETKHSESEKVEHVFTPSGIPIKSFYNPMDITAINYGAKTGDPGKPPFTRGIHASMYRARLWTMRQYAGYGTATETNHRFRHLLNEGQMGLSVAFDLPTQMGYDPDSPEALGEVGRVGVSIASIRDIEELFVGIPLEKVSTSMTINATASLLLSLYVGLAETQGIPKEKLSGTMQNDILKEYIARGTYIYPPEFSMRLAVDVIEYCTKHLPKMNPISISGYHMREAGATAVQEIAFTFANALAYLNEARKRGLSIDALGTKISFFFVCHNDFFEEIAKFRAARRLWTELMGTRLGAKEPKALMLRFHTQTAGSTLTSQQPLNNVARVTIQALAAVLGGTQSLHTNAYDEALALPTEASATLALRTQQVIAYESGVTRTADPLGGSYFIESLTEALYEKAKELLRDVEAHGGAIECVHSGYFEQAIHQSAYEYQQQVEKKEQIIVGVNAFVSKATESPPVMKIDPKLESEAVSRIRKLKEGRNQSVVAEHLDRIKKGASGSENLVPIFIQAMKSSVTLGEVCGALRKMFGEYDLR